MPKKAHASGDKKAKKKKSGQEDAGAIEGPPSVALLDMYANAAASYRTIALDQGNPAMLPYVPLPMVQIPYGAPYGAPYGTALYANALHGNPACYVAPSLAQAPQPLPEFQQYVQQPHPFAHPDTYRRPAEPQPGAMGLMQRRRAAHALAPMQNVPAPRTVHAYGSAETQLADADALARSARLAAQRQSGAAPFEVEAQRRRAGQKEAQRRAQLQHAIDKAFKAGQLVERFGGAVERATADDLDGRLALSQFDRSLSTRFAGLTQREVERETAATRRARMPPDALTRDELAAQMHTMEPRRVQPQTSRGVSHVDPDGDWAMAGGGSAARSVRRGRPLMVDRGSDAAPNSTVDAEAAPVSARDFARSSALASVGRQRLERSLHAPPTPATAATVLTQYTARGAVELRVAATSGWVAGMTAVLNVGAPNEERLFIVGVREQTMLQGGVDGNVGGALLAAEATQLAHGVGEAIIDVRARERLARTEQRNTMGLASPLARQRTLARVERAGRTSGTAASLSARRSLSEREEHAASPGWERRRRAREAAEAEARAQWQKNEWEKWQQRRERSVKPPSPRQQRSLHGFAPYAPQPVPTALPVPTAPATTPQGRWRKGFSAVSRIAPPRDLRGVAADQAERTKGISSAMTAAEASAVIAAAAASVTRHGGVAGRLAAAKKWRSARDTSAGAASAAALGTAAPVTAAAVPQAAVHAPSVGDFAGRLHAAQHWRVAQSGVQAVGLAQSLLGSGSARRATANSGTTVPVEAGGSTASVVELSGGVGDTSFLDAETQALLAEFAASADDGEVTA